MHALHDALISDRCCIEIAHLVIGVPPRVTVSVNNLDHVIGAFCFCTSFIMLLPPTRERPKLTVFDGFGHLHFRPKVELAFSFYFCFRPKNAKFSAINILRNVKDYTWTADAK